MNLVLMDFDGTITKKDTFTEFIRFNESFFSFHLRLLLFLPLIIAFKLRIIPNWRAKETVFSWFFKGENEKMLLKKGENFANEILPKLIRKKAITELEKHKNANAKIVVVTASFPIWIKPWCNQLNIDLIATHYEVIDNEITGKIKGKNCYGKEKVERVKEVFDLNKFDKIYAYGDSKGDIEMLNIADVRFMKWVEEQ